MKLALVSLMCLILLTATALPAAAQGRRDRYYRGGDYGRSYGSSRYYGYNGYRGYDNRSYWERHRDKTTVAIGTGAGAAIGALVGGGRGAVIGALIGAGTSALYTYNRRDRYYDYGSYGRSRGRYYR